MYRTNQPLSERSIQLETKNCIQSMGSKVVSIIKISLNISISRHALHLIKTFESWE